EQARDVDVTESVTNKTRFITFRRITTEGVSVCLQSGPEVFGVEHSIEQGLGMAQLDLGAARSGDLNPAPAGDVPAKIKTVNAGRGFSARDGLQGFHDPDGFGAGAGQNARGCGN